MRKYLLRYTIFNTSHRALSMPNRRPTKRGTHLSRLQRSYGASRGEAPYVAAGQDGVPRVGSTPSCPGGAGAECPRAICAFSEARFIHSARQENPIGEGAKK